jgi:RNA polymerase sigma-54 factor
LALEQKLRLQLGQRLVMTPSLQQAIKLLQMTKMELETVVAQELVENPVLEEISGDDGGEETASPEKPEPEREPEKAAEVQETKDPLAEIDIEAYFQEDDWEGQGSSFSRGMLSSEDLPPLENTLVREPDLYDHLLFQLHMSDAAPRLREFAELIIGNLDPDGFLVATVDELARLAAQPEEPSEEIRAEVERALALVRGLDPPGVACNDLRHSLDVQLRARGEAEDSLARVVVRDHWEAFLKRQFPAIAKQLSMPLADLEPVVDAIRTLEIRPGRRYSRDETQYVEPDVAVIKVGDEYVIQLNDDGLPRLRVSRSYRRMLQKMREQGGESEAQQFIKDKMRSAVWLIKSLDQRQRTIYKVADSIVRQQREFLDRGIEYLRPMVLRDVADDIGMHESTVSRVVSNKYVHTPRGLFPLKFFFHSGIDRDYGEDISSLTVKRRIQNLIQAEDAKRPLSDSELMKILQREGIRIARRTVAKYRDELRIPSSNDRKQIF